MNCPISTCNLLYKGRNVFLITNLNNFKAKNSIISLEIRPVWSYYYSWMITVVMFLCYCTVTS